MAAGDNIIPKRVEQEGGAGTPTCAAGLAGCKISGGVDRNIGLDTAATDVNAAGGGITPSGRVQPGDKAKVV